jgi:hypothetical protein
MSLRKYASSVVHRVDWDKAFYHGACSSFVRPSVSPSAVLLCRVSVLVVPPAVMCRSRAECARPSSGATTTSLSSARPNSLYGARTLSHQQSTSYRGQLFPDDDGSSTVRTPEGARRWTKTRTSVLRAGWKRRGMIE